MSTAPRAPLAQVYNEMHGLFVQVGKHYCHKQQPKCDACPLGAMLASQCRLSSSFRSKRERTIAAKATSIEKAQRNRGYNETRP